METEITVSSGHHFAVGDEMTLYNPREGHCVYEVVGTRGRNVLTVRRVYWWTRVKRFLLSTTWLWYLLLLCAFIIAALPGCASTPASGFTFEERPARLPARAEVVIKHVIAEASEVASTCSWRNRVAGSGGSVRMHPTNPACSWTEPDGTKVVLCTNPKSFNNTLALEACGHEAFHFHEVVDHR